MATVSLEVELFRMTNGLTKIGLVILGIFSPWAILALPYDSGLWIHALKALITLTALVHFNNTLLPWWQKRLRARYNV